MSAVSFDLSVLATPVRGNAAAGPRAPAQFTTKKVALPEKLDGLLVTRLAEVRARKTLVDEKASLSAVGDDRDLATSFTVYRALDALRTLSEAAASKATPAVQRAQLNGQFQAGLAELQAYLASAKTDKLTLQFGAKASKVEAVLPPRAASIYTGLAAVSGTSGTVPDGVTAADSMRITLAKGTKTDIVQVDFSEISGPITLRAIADLANSKIAAIPERDAQGNILLDGNGHPVRRYATSFSLVRTNDAKQQVATYGLQITPGTLEKISLADPHAAPSAYVVNSLAGSTGLLTAQLRRVDDIAASGSVGAAQSITAKNTDATALAKLVHAASKSKNAKAPGDVVAETRIAASAVDSQGFLYVVGSTKGALGDQADTTSEDIFLTKYDSNGVAVFSRKLGAHGTAQGAAIHIDAADNVIVAGSFDGKLSGDRFKGADTLVIKFDTAGRENFAVQLDSSAQDAAHALTVDSNGDIYVGGTVSGALNGQAAAGGQDNFIAKIHGTTGVLKAQVQFGTSGKDSLAALAMAPNGDLVVAGTENGNGILRRFPLADLSGTAIILPLGGLAGGAITSLAVDAQGDIAVGGFTRTSLNGTPLQGATDAFVAQVDSAQNIRITQFGSNGDERITGLKILGGKIYASGSTTGDLAHVPSGSSDAFLARLDMNSGAVENILQFGTPLAAASAATLAVSESGPGVLAKLGLRQGDVRPPLATTLVDRTILRSGDQFSIAVNGKSHTITINANDDARALATKLKNMLRSVGDVTLTENAAGTKIAIRATTDARIDLLSGPKDKDALVKLGLAPGQLRSSAILFDTGKDPLELARTPGGSFGLDLSDTLALDDQKSSAVVMTKIDAALETIKRAYRSLYYDPNKEALAQRLKLGNAPAYLANQASQYRDALNRLTGGKGTLA